VRALRGFSMLEIAVVILLLGAMAAIAIPSLNSLTGVELRRATGMLSGLCRDTYAKAALSGNAHRIVFDLENNSYWVERATGRVVVKRKLIEANGEGYVFINQEDERLEGTEADSKDEEERTKRALLKNPDWEKVSAPGEDGDEIKPQFLPDACALGEDDGCVRFKSVWVDHLVEPARAGQVALVFFPGGYAQEAQIALTDEDDSGNNVLTVEVLPLTGEVWIHDDAIDIPKESER